MHGSQEAVIFSLSLSSLLSRPGVAGGSVSRDGHCRGFGSLPGTGTSEPSLQE